MRLDKFISNNTEFSRARIAQAIRQGLITVNNVIATKGSVHICITDVIQVDGTTIDMRTLRYLMLHKPNGYVSATTDSEHPTVLDLIDIPFKEELQIAGRLDLDTTGLVLLTDDGQWNHKITSPKHNHTKTYLVTTADPINHSAVSVFAEGILLNGETKPTLPAELILINERYARLIICEGKYHQVKRMFAAIGNRVTALHRESIGSIVLPPDLQPGQFRALTAAEISSIENSHD